VDDLERILGYQGFAPAEVPVLRAVGPDLLAMAFWNAAFCAALVRAAEALGAFAPHPDDPVPGHEVSLALISPRLYAAVEADLGERIWPVLQQEWPLVEFCGLRDAFVIRYAKGEQELLRLHHDVAQVSASVKLNEGYTGGALAFPRQHTTNEALAVGELLAWPSLVTHPHETLPLTSGVKYALTIWFELPGSLSGSQAP
jgi:hypothetical protein